MPDDVKRAPDPTEVELALRGMVGLIQLITSRRDMPDEIRDALLKSHRYVDACALLEGKEPANAVEEASPLSEAERIVMEIGAERARPMILEMIREAQEDVAPENLGCYYSGTASALARHMLAVIGPGTTSQIFRNVAAAVAFIGAERKAH